MPAVRQKLFGGPRIAQAAIVLTAAASASALGARFHSAFTKPVTLNGVLGAGTADAPYSDALGPWLDGAMSYYLNGVPHSYLYRPTIGLFFSTIISAANSVAAVPLAWILLFFAACGVLFALGGWPFRAVLAGILAMLVVFFPELVLPLNPAALMADFWPMAMGLAGVWLIALSNAREFPSMAGAAAGFLLLGIAACVRGPQLASGPALVLMLAPGWLNRRAWLAFALLPAIFAAPFVADVAIQKKFGIESDGIVTLYGFYADPTHQWTPDANLRYLKEKPPPREVGARYLKLLFSTEGAVLFSERCATVLSHAVSLVANRWYVSILGATAAFASLARRSVRKPPSPPGRMPRLTRTAVVLLAATGAGVLFSTGLIRLLLFAVFICALAAHSAMTGRRLTAMLAVAFCSALAFHAAIGLTGGTRVIIGYEIFLFAAIVASVAEEPDEAPPSPGALRLVAGAVFVLVLIGYTGNFWLRPGFKARLRQELAVPQTAAKLSDSPRLDRSLYLTGERGLFYTRLDSTPFGQVRRYTAMNAPNGWGNVTFLRPAEVTWAPSAQTPASR